MPHRLEISYPAGFDHQLRTALDALKEEDAELPKLNDQNITRSEWIRHLPRLWLRFLSKVSASGDAQNIRIDFTRDCLREAPANADYWTISTARLEQMIQCHLRAALIPGPGARLNVFHNPPEADKEFRLPRSLGTDALVAATFGPWFGYHCNKQSDRIKYVGYLYRSARKCPLNDLLAHTDPEQRSIVITGLPRTGKTFTAFYYLFLLFVQGYDIQVSALTPTKHNIDELLENFQAQISVSSSGKPPWVFLEDPFGASTYIQDNGRVAGLCGQIAKFEKLGVRLLITSRDGLWREALERAEKLDCKEALKFLRNMRMIRLNESEELTTTRDTYDQQALIGMIVDYAALAKATWVNKHDVRDRVKKLAMKTLKEGGTILPADIVLWSLSHETRLDPETYICRLPNCSNTVAALAQDIPWYIPNASQRLVYMLPQILFLSQDDGKRLAAALDISADWDHAKNVIDEKPAQTVKEIHSTLQYCQLFHPDWAEAFAVYARDSRGLTDLADKLGPALENTKLSGGVASCLVEMIYFLILEQARLATENSLLPEPQNFRNLFKNARAASKKTPAEQRQRLHCFLDILEQLSRARLKKPVNYEKFEAELLGGNPVVLAAMGHGLADLVRLPTSVGVLNRKFKRLLDRLADVMNDPTEGGEDGTTAFMATMAISLVLGSIIEPLGEQPTADLFLMNNLASLGERPPRSYRGLAAWLTWADILVWKLGDIIRFLGDPVLGLENPSVDGEHLLKVMTWLTNQLANQTAYFTSEIDHDRRDYCWGWLLFTLLWHNDWNFKSAGLKQGPVEQAGELLRQSWRTSYENFSTMRSPHLLNGLFDNAAYHSAYHRFQATEWARLNVLRPSPRGMVRIGSKTHHETGLFGSQAADIDILEQQREIWSTLRKEAEQRYREDRNSTWRSGMGLSQRDGHQVLFSPRGCLYSFVSLRGCRGANVEKDGDQEQDDGFRSWFVKSLESDTEFNKEMWESALDLIWEGFDPLPNNRPFPPKLGPPVHQLWKEMQNRLHALIPGEAYYRHVESKMAKLFPQEKVASHAD